MKCSPAGKRQYFGANTATLSQHKSQTHELSRSPLGYAMGTDSNRTVIHRSTGDPYPSIASCSTRWDAEAGNASTCAFAASAHYRKCAQHMGGVNEINLVHHHLIKFKSYQRSPLSKRVLNSDWVMPAHCATLTSSSSVTTPFNLQAWRRALSSHPDRQFALYILSGIENGFRIRFNPDQPLHSASMNCPSAKAHPQVIMNYIRKEAATWHFFGPIAEEQAQFVHISKSERRNSRQTVPNTKSFIPGRIQHKWLHRSDHLLTDLHYGGPGGSSGCIIRCRVSPHKNRYTVSIQDCTSTLRGLAITRGSVAGLDVCWHHALIRTPLCP